MEKKTNIRWWVGIFLLIATTINYLDRSVMGIAGPSMMEDLSINATQFGILSSAFFWSYALMQLPAGAIVDKLGTKLAYIIAIIWWSIATILTGTLRSFGALIGARILMGVGEAPSFPTNTKVISDWFPSHERGIANSLLTTGIACGAGIFTPILAVIINSYGWQYAFYLCGLLGIIFAIAWGLFYKKHPSEHPKVNKAELEHILAGSATQEAAVEAAGPKVKWYSLLKYKTVWYLYFGYFAQNYILYLMLTWLPTYLVVERDMSLLKAGFNAVIPWVVTTIGALLGGKLSDYFIQKGMSPLIARRTVMAIGMALSTTIIFAAFVESAVAALVWISISLGGAALAGACVWATVADIAPKNLVGTLAGVQGFFGNIAGWVAPILTGYLLVQSGNFIAPLVVAGIVAGLAAILYAFAINNKSVNQLQKLVD